jgi:hypothetical protein
MNDSLPLLIFTSDHKKSALNKHLLSEIENRDLRVLSKQPYPLGIKSRQGASSGNQPDDIDRFLNE